MISNYKFLDAHDKMSQIVFFIKLILDSDFQLQLYFLFDINLRLLINSEKLLM